MSEQDLKALLSGKSESEIAALMKRFADAAKEAKKAAKVDKKDWKAITSRFPPREYFRVQVWADSQDTSMDDVQRAAVNEYVSRRMTWDAFDAQYEIGKDANGAAILVKKAPPQQSTTAPAPNGNTSSSAPPQQPPQQQQESKTPQQQGKGKSK